jgi:O-methyltransferase
LVKPLQGLLGRRNLALARQVRVDVVAQTDGRDGAGQGETLIGLKRLENIQQCTLDVLADAVPGDLMETGAWRGGASIFMRGVLKAMGCTDRTVYVADSFQGFPPPDPNHPEDQEGSYFGRSEFSVSLEEVQGNFRRYGLLDEQVQFLVGFFRDTLPSAAVKQLAILRLDGDTHEATTDALTHLYEKLSPGGYLIVDDYGAVPACRAAVDAYRAQCHIREEMHRIDWTGVYWRRLK